MRRCVRAPKQAFDAAEEAELKRKAYETVSAEEEKGFTRKAAPKLGEWLYTYHEAPQPLEQYRARWQVRPTSERRTIVLQPLGEMNDEQKKLLEDIARVRGDFLSASGAS